MLYWNIWCVLLNVFDIIFVFNFIHTEYLCLASPKTCVNYKIYVFDIINYVIITILI